MANRKSVLAVTVAVVAFVFLVPILPAHVLVNVPAQPVPGPLCSIDAYGSLTYVVAGLGGTLVSGTYSFSVGRCPF